MRTLYDNRSATSPLRKTRWRSLASIGFRTAAPWIAVWTLLPTGAAQARSPGGRVDERLVIAGVPGQLGGRLTIALRSEPSSLNPLTRVGINAESVTDRIHAPLVTIDRRSLDPVAALARAWRISADGRSITVELRRGLRFSDGEPFDAEDVLCTFEALLDPRNASPLRSPLIMSGQPVSVTRVDSHTVRFDMPQPRAAAERLLDGIAILPCHLVRPLQQEGRWAEAWGLSTDPAEMAGLGPFRLARYDVGERVVLERNPHYWKVDSAGQRLPYLDELIFEIVGDEGAQVLRFRSGETDLISRIGASSFLALQASAGDYDMIDLGPGLLVSMLVLNLNPKPEGRADPPERRWFRKSGFRHAISHAVDRAAIARLAYSTRAIPIGSHESPGNREWFDERQRPPDRSPSRARERLSALGFTWREDGRLLDDAGRPVRFSLATTAGREPRLRTAALIERDLAELGADVDVVPLEHATLIDRLLGSLTYDAVLLDLTLGDVDPAATMPILLSDGPFRVWDRSGAPGSSWQEEIDDLMTRQLSTPDPVERKRLYDRVQEIVARELPLIPLVSPHVLVGARRGLGNFKPANTGHITLWNAEELYWRR